MSIPNSYLISIKRLPDILEAIQKAQAPVSFTQKFLEQLGFKSKVDRLIIGVLKNLDFLDDKGTPKERYYNYLDKTKSGVVLAEAIKETWADLFAIDKNAEQMKKEVFAGKLKTISEGKLTNNLIKFHYRTFIALVKNADFSKKTSKVPVQKPDNLPQKDKHIKELHKETSTKIGGLVYNIQIVLPESRDPAVYDALFRSLKEHIL
jgi:Family of unknown function (DUF5343)